MRRQLQKILIEEIERDLGTRFPFYQRLGSDISYAKGLHFIDRSMQPNTFLFFQISDKRDAFTVELAWSNTIEFPPLSDYPVPRDWPEIGVLRGDLCKSQFRFRLTKLWLKPKYDPWWEFFPRNPISKAIEMSAIAPPSFSDFEKCKHLVNDAICRYSEFGMPYFDEIRSRRVNLKVTE